MSIPQIWYLSVWSIHIFFGIFSPTMRHKCATTEEKIHQVAWRLCSSRSSSRNALDLFRHLAATRSTGTCKTHPEKYTNSSIVQIRIIIPNGHKITFILYPIKNILSNIWDICFFSRWIQNNTILHIKDVFFQWGYQQRGRIPSTYNRIGMHWIFWSSFCYQVKYLDWCGNIFRGSQTVQHLLTCKKTYRDILGI